MKMTVLAALRALQDKIRRLEVERSQAMDESLELREQIKTLEIDSVYHADQRALAGQRQHHELQHAYDLLKTEKTEVETRMRKYEERYKQEHRHYEGNNKRQKKWHDGSYSFHRCFLPA